MLNTRRIQLLKFGGRFVLDFKRFPGQPACRQGHAFDTALAEQIRARQRRAGHPRIPRQHSAGGIDGTELPVDGDPGAVHRLGVQRRGALVPNTVGRPSMLATLCSLRALISFSSPRFSAQRISVSRSLTYSISGTA